MKEFDTPILLIIFNRPGNTEKVFEQIRIIRPKKLFIAADGPRLGEVEDKNKCKDARDIVSKTDWPCEVEKLFHQENLGCKIAVSSAIDWFFSKVEKGIILEDDCLPDQSFFPYCEELLERYKDNEKIMMITGFNPVEKFPSTHSYLFSRYASIWGWATWRRAWKKYDVSMKSWSDKYSQDKIKKRISSRKYWKIKRWTYNKVFLGEKNTWDYQWEYAILLNCGLSIVPKNNLIQNIGIDNGTHETPKNFIPPNKSSIKFPLSHERDIVPNLKYDNDLISKKSNMSKRIFYISIFKKIIPPIIYDIFRNFLKKERFNSTWVTLKYPPLDGINMYFDPSGPWQQKMVNGNYDNFLFERLKKINTLGKVIFDIGAHIGYHSLYFAKLVGPSGKIVSFEPSKVNVERFKLILEKNQDISKNITLVDSAVSNINDFVTFTTNTDVESGRSSGNFIEQADTFWKKDVYKNKGFISSQVKTVRLDHLEEDTGIKEVPDIMKIDVEGAEYLVLLGAQKILETKKPIIFIEIHSIQNMFNVVTLLRNLSYKVEIIKNESSGICFLEAIHENSPV